MKLKKKDACILVGALSCLFFLTSFSLVFQLEDLGYRELVRRRRAEVKGEIQGYWINEFFIPQCQCAKSKPQYFKNAIDVHELAVHTVFDHDTCYLTRNISNIQDADIQVDDLLRKAQLRYPQYLYHQSGWIQEMDVTYSTSQWRKDKPLKVFFVLHSHNDPGWLQTYSSYYSSWTGPTLDRAIAFLERDPELKFVWAEVIYLQYWYQQASATQRRLLKRLIRDGQFEVVTGGWVMTDEATAHYGAMLEQLITGHTWLANTLDVKPEYGWAIDPFGHSSTMTYLLKRTGLKGNVLQRIHYALKRHLAYKKQLEFNWKQIWGSSDTALFSHVMPFLYYNIPYSCGPDIQTCCRLDFHASKCWAWGEYQKPTPVTNENVHELAVAVLDQLRKKAQFYDHNVLLVPHGDDFRYSSSQEWTAQTENLKALFSYMNGHPNMNVQIQFGTVADYFKAVKSAQTSPTRCNTTTDRSCVQEFPTLTGDFFTYTDRDDQYWSGFFTSRPFLKVAIRQLQASLRSTEILYTLTQAHALRKNYRRFVADVMTSQFRSIEVARDALGLLQHHDAVTGTARKSVTADYYGRARSAIADVERVATFLISVFLQLVLNPKLDTTKIDTPQLEQADRTVVSFPTDHRKLEEMEITKMIIVHNPLTVERTDVIKLTVTSPDVMVKDIQGNAVQCQLAPMWVTSMRMADDEFELSVEVTIPALAIARYLLQPAQYNTGCPKATLKVYNAKAKPPTRNPFILRHYSLLDTPVTIETKTLQATICECTGLLKTVTNKIDSATHHTEVRFVTYGTGSWKNPYRDKSGAYIFMPDGAAQELQYDNPIIIVTEGPLLSSVKTEIPLVTQKITLLNTTGPLAAAVHVENTVNLIGEKNLEIALRIMSDVINDDHIFHTDLNGFQMSRRETLRRLPLQANFYPVTSAMFVQDKLFRLTALTAQSHGAASLHTGWLEFMLDRELEQDDWRGLREGVKDNLPTTSSFILLWETRRPHHSTSNHGHNQDNHDDDSTQPSMGFLSLLAHINSQALNNPLRVRIQVDPLGSNSDIANKGAGLIPVTLEPLNKALPCDLHLVNLRTYDGSKDDKDPGGRGADARALLVLHRLASDCEFPEVYQRCQPTGGRVRWTELFSQVRISSVEKTSLTGTRDARKLHHTYLNVHPMEISTFKVAIS